MQPVTRGLAKKQNYRFRGIVFKAPTYKRAYTQ